MEGEKLVEKENTKLGTSLIFPMKRPIWIDSIQPDEAIQYEDLVSLIDLVKRH